MRPPPEQLSPLPRDACRARCSTPLLDRPTETDLFEKPQLLVLATNDLDEMVLGTAGKRTAEAERGQELARVGKVVRAAGIRIE